MSITTSGFNEVRQAVDMGIFRGRFGWRHQKQVRKSYICDVLFLNVRIFKTGRINKTFCCLHLFRIIHVVVAVANAFDLVTAAYVVV